MNYLYSNKDNFTQEIFLVEASEGGWILFYYGMLFGRFFHVTVALKSINKEDAVEEVYEFLLAGDDIDKRHDVLSILSINPKGEESYEEDGIITPSNDDIIIPHGDSNNTNGDLEGMEKDSGISGNNSDSSRQER